MQVKLISQPGPGEKLVCKKAGINTDIKEADP